MTPFTSAFLQKLTSALMLCSCTLPFSHSTPFTPNFTSDSTTYTASLDARDQAYTITQPPVTLSPIEGVITWCPALCECFNGDDTVDCSRAGLAEIPPLRNSTKRLYLEDNRVSQLTRSSFREASNLSLLVVERNELTAIDVVAFCDLVQLQELELSGNRIRVFSIEIVMECQAVALKEIDLSLNLLRSLPERLVRFAPNLEILNLSFNEIVSVALDSTYAEMTSLRYLDLSRNRVHALLESDFTPLNGIALEILNLAVCELLVVEPGALFGLGNLTSFSVSGNTLRPEELSDVLKRFAVNNILARLDVSEINLTNLTISMLGSFKRLVVLDAAYCALEWVEPEVFDVVSQSLESLHLEGGKLRQLDNLGALRKLRRLHLQENRLESVDLHGIQTLESLDLSYNRLEVIHAYWLADLQSLQTLNLSHNLIKVIEAEAFSGVNIISTLDVSFNSLEALRGYGLVGLARLDASHNVIITIDHDAFFGLEETLKEIDVSDNRLSDFARLVGPEIDTIVNELRRPFATRILNLGHNYLGEEFASHSKQAFGQVTSSIRFFQQFPKLEVVDLSRNGIVEIACDVFRSLRNLNQLKLRDNNVSDLRATGLWCTSTLARLYISNNQLNVIDVVVLQGLTYLEEVDFSGNPFTCDCGLGPFLRWVNETNAIGGVTLDRFSDWMSYQCSRPASMAGAYLFSEQTNQRACARTASRWLAMRRADAARSRDVIELTLAVTSVVGLMVVGLVIAGALTWKKCLVREKVKLMKYRWQIRYREVSDLDTAMDGNMCFPLTEPLKEHDDCVDAAKMEPMF